MNLESLKKMQMVRFGRIKEKVIVGNPTQIHLDIAKMFGEPTPESLMAWTLFTARKVAIPEKNKIEAINKPTDLDFGFIRKADSGIFVIIGESETFRWPPREMLPEIREVTLVAFDGNYPRLRGQFKIGNS